VPSDDRPEHLINTWIAAEAASAASMVEACEPPTSRLRAAALNEDEDYCDEERYALGTPLHA
jgi:hypothetical protein